jgi:N-methylhydantoinase B
MAAPVQALDVVTASILSGKLEAVVQDMATTLANVVHSRQLSTSRLFACALVDERGQVVATDSPLHLPQLQATVATCLEAYRFDTACDDVIVTNDPYGGGSSVHYLTLVAPFGVQDDTVAYLAIRAHMPDIGGTVMGNYHPTAWELWQEGTRFTPLKIVTEGKRRRSAVDTLLLNGREAEAYRGDLDAVLATAEVGRERLDALVSEYGLGLMQQGMEASLAYSERRFRAALAQLPDGTYEGASTLDHDGQGRTDLTVRVALQRTEDGVRLDFAGTDEQSAGFVNSPPGATRAYALLPLLGLIDGSVSHNAGLLRALDVVAPDGTLVAPTYPAPTGWCQEHVGFEIAEAVGGALAAAMSVESGVGHASRPLLFSIDKQRLVGGVEEQLRRTDYGLLSAPGSAASAHGDGWGVPGSIAGGELPSVEEFEAENDLTIELLEYRTDSGGAGRHRGAPSTETVVRLPSGGHERLYACSAAVRHTPRGWAGGLPGAAARLQLEVDGETRDIPDVEVDRPLPTGARLRILAAGGGGFGDPRDRPDEQVRADVEAGYVSAEAARELYGLSGTPAGHDDEEDA